VIIIQMMGAFSQLENEWRKERRKEWIKRAQEKGVYDMRERHREGETKKEYKTKTIKVMR